MTKTDWWKPYNDTADRALEIHLNYCEYDRGAEVTSFYIHHLTKYGLISIRDGAITEIESQPFFK